MSDTIKMGDTVTIHYKVKVEDDRLIDQTKDEPFTFTLGNEEIVPGLEDQMIGLELNEKKSIFVPMEDAYGPYLDELVLNIPKDHIQVDQELELDTTVTLSDEEGNSFPANVVEIAKDHIVVDANHDLADHDLTFEIEVLKIES